jgi:hypothetical protein
LFLKRRESLLVSLTVLVTLVIIRVAHRASQCRRRFDEEPNEWLLPCRALVDVAVGAGCVLQVEFVNVHSTKRVILDNFPHVPV